MIIVRCWSVSVLPLDDHLQSSTQCILFPLQLYVESDEPTENESVRQYTEVSVQTEHNW